MKFSNGLTEEMLNAGMVTEISGELITLRDQSVKKIVELVKNGVCCIILCTSSTVSAKSFTAGSDLPPLFGPKRKLAYST